MRASARERTVRSTTRGATRRSATTVAAASERGRAEGRARRVPAAARARERDEEERQGGDGPRARAGRAGHGRGMVARRRAATDHYAPAVIARYTRPEMGALWTDEARMEAWRLVEVAAAEELDGPTEEDLRAIRAATFTVEAVQEREAVTDHDVAAFVDVLAESAGPAGSLDPLRAHLLRRPRHRAGPAALARRRAARGRGARARRRARRPRARARRHRLRRAHPRRSTPSRRRSGSSSPGSPSRRTATSCASSAPSTRRRRAR